MYIARDPVPLFEHGLMPRFRQTLFREPALMKRERGLTCDRFERRPAPRRIFNRRIAGRQRHPSEVACGQSEWDDGDQCEAGRPVVRAHRFGQTRVVAGVLDRLIPARLVREKMRRHFASRRSGIPTGNPFRIELIADVRHPRFALRAFFIEKPRGACAALSLIEECLQQNAKEAIGIGFAHEEIERELHGMTLYVRHALSTFALVRFVFQLLFQIVETL